MEEIANYMTIAVQWRRVKNENRAGEKFKCTELILSLEQFKFTVAHKTSSPSS